MSKFFLDEELPNLLWVKFDGHTWDEYSELFTNVATFARSNTEPIVIAFEPESEMPRGAPLTHLKWTAELVKKEPNILHMYAIVDATKFVAGRVFAELATKLFFAGAPLNVVPDRNAVHEAYQKLMSNSD